MRYLPPPLFWHICVLTLASGVLASRYPAPALACLAVILVGAGILPLPRLGLALLSFALGAGLGLTTAPLPTQVVHNMAPAWWDSIEIQRVRGTVAEVSGQPDRRLRLLLENVRPAVDPAPPASSSPLPPARNNPPGDPAEGASLPGVMPLPGRVNLSWDQGARPDLPRPLPGQTIP